VIATDLQQTLLNRFGVRVEPHMSAYVQRRLSDRGPLPVIGGDARTGRPVRLMIDPAQLTAGPRETADT